MRHLTPDRSLHVSTCPVQAGDLCVVCSQTPALAGHTKGPGAGGMSGRGGGAVGSVTKGAGIKQGRVADGGGCESQVGPCQYSLQKWGF